MSHGQQYSPNIRLFSLRQQFYSNAAYESLRTYFNNHLPSKRTLQKWYSSVDGAPGININALNIIREKADFYEAEHGFPLHLTMISDEMSIRKDPCWRGEAKKFIGCSSVINTSQQNQEKPLKSAKDALAFLIVGPNFKLPVAYYLLNGLESIDRAVLTRSVIRNIEACNVKIMSLTSDGLRANLTTAELLGAKFNERKTFFQSPKYPEQRIHIIFDPPHMLKLVRKHFSSGNLHSSNSLLDWNLLCVLVDKQRGENFNMGNQLTQHHINWHLKPMNVRLDAQTISKSVADSLEQLQEDGFSEFENAAATVQFLRYFNNLFDILNFGEGRSSNNEYKQTISNDTVDIIFSYLKDVEAYIKCLMIKVHNKNGTILKPIFKSRAQMGFYGFHIDIISLIGIYNDFVRDGPLNIFHPFQFSQDHLETLFSLIRNSQGRNDNPSPTEFASAFRKIMICHPLITSRDHNVITNATGILTVPCKSQKRQKSKNFIDREDLFNINYTEMIIQETMAMDDYDKHICAFVALWIEKRIFRETKNAHRSRCLYCAEILFEQAEKIDDTLLMKKNKENHQPCKSTIDIVIFSNAVIKMFPSDARINFDDVHATIHNNLKAEELYSNSIIEHDGQYHKETFLFYLVETYLKMKSERIGKLIGDEERGSFLRNRLNTQIHLAGQ